MSKFTDNERNYNLGLKPIIHENIFFDKMHKYTQRNDNCKILHLVANKKSKDTDTDGAAFSEPSGAASADTQEIKPKKLNDNFIGCIEELNKKQMELPVNYGVNLLKNEIELESENIKTNEMKLDIKPKFTIKSKSIKW